MTERRSATLRQGIVVAAAILMAGFWFYVLFIAPSAPEDKLKDPAFARAAQSVCSRALDDLSAANVLNQKAATPQQRADFVARSDSRLRAMVGQLHAIIPNNSDDRAAVTAWLDDWDQWLRDRAAWGDELRAGHDVPFNEKARENGEPNSKALIAFAVTNEMGACQTPYGL